MKLYATVTSERASKGQGGNDYLRIKLTVTHGDGNQREMGTLMLDEGYALEKEMPQFVLSYAPYDDREAMEIDRVENRKGNKQKGEWMCKIDGCNLQREYAPGLCDYHFRNQ